MFVGAIPSLNSPNADSMIWFSEDILPLIQESLGKDVKLIIAGLSCPEFPARFNNGSIQLVGKVDDLAPLYMRIPVIVSSDSGANVSSIPVIVSSVPGQREQDGRSLTLA